MKGRNGVRRINASDGDYSGGTEAHHQHESAVPQGLPTLTKGPAGNGAEPSPMRRHHLRSDTAEGIHRHELWPTSWAYHFSLEAQSANDMMERNENPRTLLYRPSTS